VQTIVEAMVGQDLVDKWPFLPGLKRNYFSSKQREKGQKFCRHTDLGNDVAGQ
jgi:hypothetical protein